MEELARHRCLGDDGATLIVVEYRHVFTSSDGGKSRRHHGARWLALLDGEPVRHIDAGTFEVVASGELLRREVGGVGGPVVDQPLSERLADMPARLRVVLIERFTDSPLAYHNLSHIDQMLAEMALEQRARANMRWEQAALAGDAPSVEAALGK